MTQPAPALIAHSIDAGAPYRPDIDGLRAIAVVAVIVYHFRPGWLPGGYLGVDLFFVISGFLITGIIRREQVAGNFSVARFYARRVRRILPALTAMMLVVTPASMAILLPVDLSGYAKSLLATIGFVSNIYFWRDTDYFSRGAAEKPLLHTWSLGVEEQFYILFPVLLLVLRSASARTAGLAVLALSAASLALYIYANSAGAGLPAFYLLPTRAWELGAGAALALFAPRSFRFASVLAAAALAALGYALLTAAPVGPVPASAILVAATVILIGSGAGGGPVARWVGATVPRFIGQISYSLYLWHWPVIVLAQYWLVRELTGAETVLEAMAITALAVASWRLVERPFRARAMPFRRVAVWLGGGTAVLLALAGLILTTDGLPQRLPPEAARINAAVGTNYRCPVQNYLAFGASRACTLGLAGRDPATADVVLLGNSHAQMYAPLVERLLRERGLQGLLVPANGCLPSTGVNLPGCAAIAQTNLDAVLTLKNARLVIIGLSWQAGRDQLVDNAGKPLGEAGLALLAAGVDDTAARLRAAGKEVIIVGPIATPGWDIASQLGRRLAFGRPVDRPLSTSAAGFQTQLAPVFTRFADRSDIGFVRPDSIQCAGGRCSYLLEGRSLFADDNHLAAAELTRFEPVFAPAIDAAWKRAEAR